MDIIIQGYLKKFVELFGYEDKKENQSINFEKFCFYSILANEIQNYNINEQDLEEISVGKNKGIDGICLIVNGNLVYNIESITDLKEKNGYIDASIYFFQAKTSSKFEDSEISNLCDTVKDFLTESPNYALTQDAKEFHKVVLYLYNNMVDLRNFDCKIFYCTTGTWKNNTSCQQTVDIKINELNSLEIFKEEVEIIPADREYLKKLFDKAQNPLLTEFTFVDRAALEGIENVDEAYIGILPFSEFRKIITDPETDKLRSLFYDNVRDDLGEENKVNLEIEATLKNAEFSIFPLLNNGVTIIAEENKGRMNKFILSNFQIVNGCQTSNVLFRNKNDRGIEHTKIPIKLIITKDEEIKDKIIISTNNQTQIKEEQLLSLTKFQKGLESFYQFMNDGLYYERRIAQFANTDIKKKDIIDIREQIKTFVSMFLDEPHVVSGYFGKVYKERKNHIFLIDHKYEPYYVSGLTQYRFKEFLKNKRIDKKFNKARYHIFMLFRKLTEPSTLSDFASKKIVNYCDELIKILRDEKRCLESFHNAIDIIIKSSINTEIQKEIYKKSTTNTLLEEFNSMYK